MAMEFAYAKLNLSLNILGKRPDGFHNLESIMVPVVDLYDTLEFEARDDNQFIIVDDAINDNIILKAAKLFQEKYHTKGAIIKLTKRIPTEAGLAGGSADASATLRGLNKLFNLNISLHELEELASSLGSDTVFCLYNKAAICKGRGEILEFINFDFSFNTWILKPSFGLLTKDVFRHYKGVKTLIQTNEILFSLKNNNIDKLDNFISNDLYEPASLVNNKIEKIVKILNENHLNAHMSGSGSTVFIIEPTSQNYEETLTKVLEKNKIEYVYLNKHLVKNAVKDC